MIKKFTQRQTVRWTGIVVACLLMTLWPGAATSQTYSLYVGESTTLYAPNAPAGSMDAASWSSNSSCVGVSPGGYRGSSCTVTVNKHFSGTATIECYMSYSYYSTYTKRMVVDHVTKYYYIQAKVSTLTLNATEITLEPGDEYELKYTSSPSGLDLYPVWSTSDYDVVSLDNDWGYGSSVKGGNNVTVYAKAVGTCTITCEANTGARAPTCIVHVEDNRPHITVSPDGGSVKAGTLVTLTCDRSDADIHYTTNGDTPTRASTKYTAPIELTKSCTLKAIAYDGDDESKVVSKSFTVVAHEDGDVFTYTTMEGAVLTVKAYKSGSYITLQIGEGEEGRPAVDPDYNGHITIPSAIDGMGVYRIGEYAFDGCKLASVEFNGNYNSYVLPYAFRGCDNLVQIEVPSYTFLSSWAFKDCKALRMVSFESRIVFGTENSHSRNNTDNVFSGCDAIRRVYAWIGTANYSIPDNVFSASVYENATLYVPESDMRYASSVDGWKKFKNVESKESAKENQVQLSSSLSGTFGVTAGERVYIESSNVPDADIYYTLDGTTPSQASTRYNSAGIAISRNCTLKAMAYKSGYEDSNVLLSGTYFARSAVANPVKGVVRQIAAGRFHSFLLKDDGTLWACGYNEYGQQGDGTTTDRSVLEKVMDDVRMVSAGHYHYSLIVKTDGSLWACGYNREGQLGDGTTTNRPTPVKIMDDVASASAGIDHSLILKTDGTLWACGDDYYGQLGDGRSGLYKERLTPVKMTDGVAAMAAGTDFSLVVMTDGTLWACGRNNFGQLGDGTKTDRSRLVKVEEDVASVSAGTYHSLVLKTDGTLWACGNNSDGQLGDGTKTDRSRLVKVEEDVASVSAGSYYSLVLKTDGTLWACGINSYGQLGDGTTYDRTTPVCVMNGVAQVSANSAFSLAVKTDGTVWSWGVNGSGQLGDGTEHNSAMPILMGEKSAEPQDVSIAAAGYATFYSSESAYTLPSGLTAQVVTGGSDSKLTYQTLTGGLVPAGTAVMLVSSAKQSETFTLTPSDNTAAYSGPNLLHGSDEATTTTGDGLHYKLAYGPSSDSSLKDVFGWYWGAQQGAPFQIEGHKAWLVLPQQAGTRTAGYSIDGGALGIEEMEGRRGKMDDCLYDLQGRRMENTQSSTLKKGLYIQNGKKIVNK